MTKPSAPLQETRVFLAEDHFAIALALTGMLEEFGCTVVAKASTAAAAAEVARTVDADCALLDINMGDGHCYEAARQCRERGIPVIFTTGYDEPPGLPPELDDVPRLLKPVDKVDLRRTLEALRRHP